MLSRIAAFLPPLCSLSFRQCSVCLLFSPAVFIPLFVMFVSDECNVKVLTASHSLGKGCSDAPFRRSSGLKQRHVAAEQVVENYLTWNNGLCLCCLSSGTPEWACEGSWFISLAQSVVIHSSTWNTASPSTHHSGTEREKGVAFACSFASCHNVFKCFWWKFHAA